MGTDVSRSGKDITTTQPWQALEAHKPILAERHLRELFADNPSRGRELTIDVGDLHIDYSKHRIDAETIAARVAGLTVGRPIPGRAA